MRKYLRIVLIALLIMLVVLQFYRPQRNDSQYREVAAFEKETGVPGKVKTILKTNAMIAIATRRIIPGMPGLHPFLFGLMIMSRKEKNILTPQAGLPMRQKRRTTNWKNS